MDIFNNKKVAIIILSSGLLILIVFSIFPNIFGRRTIPAEKENTEITQIKTQSNDTSLDSIKKDLDNTDVSNLDKELNNIEKELNAAI